MSSDSRPEQVPGASDLTRWNRAGRSAFRYVDGNAVVWLEALRAALRERFSTWTAVDDGAPSDESDAERLRRLETQYAGTDSERGDLLFELTREAARACHVLTEHIDAYANEGYLRTATQWDNVRRLVEMIDYHPAPPASASTLLVLEAKAGAAGEVDSGFQVKHAPPEGGPPVIFETLESINVDASLNALRLADHDRAQVTFTQAGAGVWLAGSDAEKLSAGQVGLLVSDGERPGALVVEISSVSAAGVVKFTTLPDQSSAVELSRWLLPDLDLHADPAQVQAVLPVDSRSLVLGADHGLETGDVIAWQAGNAWSFSSVSTADANVLGLQKSGPVPAVGTPIYKASLIERPASGDFNFAVASPGRRVGHRRGGAFELVRTSGRSNVIVAETDSTTGGRYYRVTDNAIRALYVAPDTSDGVVDPVGTVRAQSDSHYEISGGPGLLTGGQWVAAECDGVPKWRALQIDQIVEREDSFLVRFIGVSPPSAQITRLYGGFGVRLAPKGADQNMTALSETERKVLDLEISAGGTLPSALSVGRSLIVEKKTPSGYTGALRAAVSAVNGRTVTLASALPAAAGFTRWNTVVRANVVYAGHGERQPERVLGSGDATSANQYFVFGDEGVSFVADSTMSSGVRADITVRVDGQIWTQVGSLNDSSPTDPHFIVNMTEEGFVRLRFGDGVHGRRLPTGTGNVRLAWRKGSGLAGGVAAHSVFKPIKPHRLVDGVRQPLRAVGGAEMEAASSLRENAPAALFTLDRAVSLADFKALAASHSSVWRANAFDATHGLARDDAIEVVVVPSGGGELGTLREAIERQLASHALPGVTIRVSPYESVLVHVQAQVQVKVSAFDPQAVVTAVTAAIRKAFSLEVRGLGEALDLSQLYAVVEAVAGVENSTCRLLSPDESGSSASVTRRENAAGVLQALQPNGRQVVHVAKDGAGVGVDWREYQQ